MSLILVLSLQAAAVATPAAPAPPPAERGQRWAMPALIAREGVTPLAFDLERLRAAGPATCLTAAPGDVLVCGARRGGAGAFPMAMWDRIFAPRPIRAEMNLGGNIQGRIHSEAVPMDRGAVSNRVMIGIRWPF